MSLICSASGICHVKVNHLHVTHRLSHWQRELLHPQSMCHHSAKQRDSMCTGFQGRRGCGCRLHRTVFHASLYRESHWYHYQTWPSQGTRAINIQAITRGIHGRHRKTFLGYNHFILSGYLLLSFISSLTISDFRFLMRLGHWQVWGLLSVTRSSVFMFRNFFLFILLFLFLCHWVPCGQFVFLSRRLCCWQPIKAFQKAPAWNVNLLLVL